MSDAGFSRGEMAVLHARCLLDYVRALGMSPEALFPEFDIAGIESGEAKSELPFHEWLAMVAQATAQSEEPDLALKVGEKLQIRHLGLAGYVLMSCSTLGEAEEQIGRYMRLLGNVGRSRVERHGDYAEQILEWHESGPPPPAIEQIFTAASASLARWLSDRPDLCWEAHFRCSQPVNLQEYRRIFRSEPRFEQPHTLLRFPAEYLDLPVTVGNPDLRQVVEARATAALNALADTQELLDRVRAIAAADMSSGHASIESAAAQIGLSSRSLRRRLDEFGTSFREIMDQQRQIRAEALLRNSKLSLAEITFLLGYTEQSSFQNSFKRWTGLTPGQFRGTQTRIAR